MFGADVLFTVYVLPIRFAQDACDERGRDSDRCASVPASKDAAARTGGGPQLLRTTEHTGVMLLLLLLLFYTRESTVERGKKNYTNTRLCGFLGPRPGPAGRRIRLICLGRLIPGRKTEWNGERPGGTETRVIGQN